MNQSKSERQPSIVARRLTLGHLFSGAIFARFVPLPLVILLEEPSTIASHRAQEFLQRGLSGAHSRSSLALARNDSSALTQDNLFFFSWLLVRYRDLTFSTSLRNLTLPGCLFIDPPRPRRTSRSVGVMAERLAECIRRWVVYNLLPRF